MSNPKIPQGYQGTYARAADGSATLIMVSRSDSITDYTEKKEQKTMSEQQQPNSTFTPYTTEQKREFAKQFTPEQRKSYRKGQQSAYAHMGNIGKRNSFFIYNNLKNDEAATPPPAPPAEKPKGNGRKSGNK
jgi:hypothetical protein